MNTYPVETQHMASRLFLSIAVAALALAVDSNAIDRADNVDEAHDVSDTHDHPEADHADAHSAEHAHEHDPSGERRQAGAHQHGGASLAVAKDGSELIIEFDTPLYNLTGFEHAPSTQTQKQLLATVEEKLSDPMRLFIMGRKAGCTARDVEDVHLFDEDGHADASESHRDVLVTYTFRCRAPERLDNIDVQLFDAFSRLESLDVVYLDETTQGAMSLTPADTKIRLDP